jgi:hypothetical protein
MNKHWKKNNGTSFTFFADDYGVGEMNFIANPVNKTATFNIGQDHYSIKQRGFWNSNLSVIDTNEAEILKMYTEKWYANNWVVEYDNIKYKLSVRNNPLAEYVITEGNKEILAYGLQPDNGKVQVKITASPGQRDFIFDFLLWHLFAPVALENAGENLSFTLLFV